MNNRVRHILTVLARRGGHGSVKHVARAAGLFFYSKTLNEYNDRSTLEVNHYVLKIKTLCTRLYLSESGKLDEYYALTPRGWAAYLSDKNDRRESGELYKV